MSGKRDVVRWLLRPLGDQGFLRLYLSPVADGHPSGSLAYIEQLFWALPADIEHPEEARADAWCWLADQLSGLDSRTPGADVFITILRRLRERAAFDDDIHDLARFWAAPELFASESPARAERETEPIEGHHEIHCHLRGAVPYPYLWHGWCRNQRWRASLRGDRARSGTWEKTWAELVGEADSLAQRFELDVDGRDVSPEDMIRARTDIALGQDDERARAAAKYLAIYTALRRSLLYQRGDAGLVRFTDAYDRYSKVQKPRSQRDLVRNHVAAIMRRFAQQGTAAVELRPTLDNSHSELLHKLRSVMLGYFDYVRDTIACQDGDSDVRPIVLGIVPSFFKQQRGILHSAVDARQQVRIWHHQLDVLFDVLDEVPALRWLVVGVDAAGRERGCPLRAFAPLFARIDERNRSLGLAWARPGRTVEPAEVWQLVTDHFDKPDPSLAVFESFHDRSVPHVRLGRTMHAGEDFVDPMTGLRHIWEALEHYDMRAGDRLGHALAVALAPDSLLQLLEHRASPAKLDRPRLTMPELIATDENDGSGPQFRVYKPRGVHVLDLAWLAKCSHTDSQRARWLAELAHHGQHAAGVPTRAERLLSSLHTGNNAIPLFGVRFDSPDKIDAEDRTWHVIDDAWCDEYERMRRYLVAEIKRREVVVESCPTSNLAIARTRTPPAVQLVRDGIQCAIATDDPGLLGCWPNREYQLVERALDNDTRSTLIETARQAGFIRTRAG